jgi:hypothetical protein
MCLPKYNSLSLNPMYSPLQEKIGNGLTGNKYAIASCLAMKVYWLESSRGAVFEVKREYRQKFIKMISGDDHICGIGFLFAKCLLNNKQKNILIDVEGDHGKG